MKDFLDKDFLLKTTTAKRLFHDYAADMPIIDYHCHLSPKDIAEDRIFNNIAEVWLHGDHYKWGPCAPTAFMKVIALATNLTLKNLNNGRPLFRIRCAILCTIGHTWNCSATSM